MKETKTNPLELDIFAFDHYREYLIAALPVRGNSRGMRARLAIALGCQNGFISQVLSGMADFSLEHACKISQFLKLSEAETEFFLLLVHHARSGSVELQKYYERQLNKIRSARRKIKNRVNVKGQPNSIAEQMEYYSQWYFSAIHMCTIISSLQTHHEIAQYLNLAPETVSKTLETLARLGYVRVEGAKYIGRPERIHLPDTSLLISIHHNNWRMQAIDSLQRNREQDLHFSSVMCISKSASEKIRKILLDSIQSAEPIIKDAKEENVFALNIDLFEIRRP